ncbi:MAG: ATP-binding protein [Chloroflexota bacterium]
MPALPAWQQRRQVLRIVALASLPLVVLVVIGIMQGKVLAEARVAEERVAQAQAAALTANAFVDGNLSTAQSLARAPAILAATGGPRLQALFDAVLAENPEWEGWGLAAPDGWNIVSTGAAPGTLNVADRPYFQEALRSGQPVVSPPVLNRRTGNPTVVLALPLDFERGGRGAIIVSLSTARLASELQQLQRDPSIQISLVDKQGVLFAGVNASVLSDLPSMRGHQSVEAALRGETGSLVSSGSGTEELIAYAPVPRLGWGIVVSQPASAAFDVVRRQTTLGIVILALALSLAGVISWYLGGRLAELYRRQREATLRAEAAARALERVSAESERRRLFLEGVIESAPVAIAVLSGREYRHETVNDRYEALQPDTPMPGRTLDEVFPETTAQGMREIFDRVFASGEQVVLVDQAWDFGSGPGAAATHYCTHVVSRLDDEAGAPDAILSMVLDTTDVVLARRRAEREKDELLSTASHELKTPLTSLGLAAEMIDRMLVRGPLDEARLARHAATIRSQLVRLGRLIGSLLDVSRIQTGRLALSWEPVNLAMLARLAIVRERDALPESSMHEIVLHEDGSPVVAEGDEARLEQVVSNLLSNAVKYSPRGGLVEVVVAQEDDRAILEVVDRGIGVPEEERDRLFAPFSRTPTAVEAGVEGTGLGLYISHRIVEAHGGSIELRDTPGGGSTFRVTLPIKHAEPTRDAA